MCGRFALTLPVEAMARLFAFAERPNLAPRYNIAPTQPIVVIGLNAARCVSLGHMRWGLIPSWSKTGTTDVPLFNARAETVEEKPSFRNAVKRRRCLIPADGFYEWQSRGKSKQPFFISLKHSPLMAMAGIWEEWEGPNGELLDSAAIITTQASAEMSAYHHRMPVILAPEHWPLWLEQNEQVPHILFQPLPDGSLDFRAVTPQVGRVDFEGPQCLLEKIDEPAAKKDSPLSPRSQLELF